MVQQDVTRFIQTVFLLEKGIDVLLLLESIQKRILALFWEAFQAEWEMIFSLLDVIKNSIIV